MNIYIDGVLTPPADAGSLDGIPAALQPVGPGEDGHVVTYVHASGDLELKPGGGGGMVNPMNAVGNLIVGGPVVGGIATPTRLAIGPAGYILRSVAGAPAWREISAAGTAVARPTPAAAVREGQTYWSTDAAAGQQLSICLHQGGPTYAWETLAYGVTATGAALVQAADAAAARTAIGLGGAALLNVGSGAGDVAAGNAPAAAVAARCFVIPLAGYITNTGPLTAVALVTFDPTLYAITGKTGTLTLETTGSVSAGGITGTVTLQNLTNTTTDATIPIVSTLTVTQTAVVAPNIALLASAKVYELRISLIGVGYVVAGAILRINWS